MKKLLFIIFCLCLSTWGVQAQIRVVKGTVISKTDKAPIPGATVYNQNTKGGVATDIDGKFSLKVNAGDTLMISFIGFKTQHIKIVNQKELNVTLEEESVQIDDVVVIGYGSRNVKTLTGAINTVSAKKLEMLPVPNFDQAMQGQAPGMLVMSSSGAPGAAADVSVRGINSITAGTTPLYIMDGVVVAAGDFQSLNTADIESVTVLKDAASTSIYGARASNGVILITTKRGTYGQQGRVNLRVQHGWSTIANKKDDMMNTSQRLDYEEMIGMHAGDPNYDRADYEGIDVDWQDVIYNDHAPTTSYDLSISGGSQTIAYYMSANYMTQEGIAPMSDFTRYNFRLNWEGKVKPWLKAGGSLTLGHEKNDATQTGRDLIANPANTALLMLPYWNPYKEDGSITVPGDGSWKGEGYNPLEAYAKNRFFRERTKGVGSLFLEVNPIEGLTVKSILGLDGGVAHDIHLGQPSFSWNNGDGSRADQYLRNYTLTMTNTLNYKFSLAHELHNFDILLGQEAIQNETDNLSGSVTGLSDDRLVQLSSGITPASVGGGKNESSFLSFFGRLSYSLDDKYFLDLSLRTDGSSRFGADNRYATFWSAGAMWRIVDEAFMEKIPFISNLQLSVSAGTSGNSSIGDYDHLALIVGGASYNGISAWVPTGLGNESLTWEKLFDVNVGLKIGLWNRLNMSIEYYNKKTTAMLMSVPISLTNGFSSWMDNVGKMRNQGIDFQLDATVLKYGDFMWNFTGNFSYNQNKILELYNGQDYYALGNAGSFLKVGDSYGSIQAVRYAGVNPANGDAMWYDKDGKLVNKFSTEDKVSLGKSYIAPWYGGFTNNFSYKGIQLSVFFTWVADRYMLNSTRYFTENNGRSPQYNQSTKMFEAWQKPGDITEIPRYGIVMETDDHLIEDASFLRLKNLSLAYSLPSSVLKYTKVVEAVKIFVQAQNLLTFTKWSGFDPEDTSYQSVGAYPTTKQFTFGIDLTF